MFKTLLHRPAIGVALLTIALLVALACDAVVISTVVLLISLLMMRMFGIAYQKRAGTRNILWLTILTALGQLTRDVYVVIVRNSQK